jgi:hypothetical protein
MRHNHLICVFLYIGYRTLLSKLFYSTWREQTNVIIIYEQRRIEFFFSFSILFILNKQEKVCLYVFQKSFVFYYFIFNSTGSLITALVFARIAVC